MITLSQPHRSPVARAWACILVAVLVVGLIPAPAWAARDNWPAPSPDLRDAPTINHPSLGADPWLLAVACSLPASGDDVQCLWALAEAQGWGSEAFVRRGAFRLTKSAFGEVIGRTGTDPQPYQFAGEPYDPNVGFSYNRARWMDPHTGRFVGMDSFAGRLTDPATLHRYVYASADPSNMKDPTGQFFEASFSIGLSFTLSGMSVPSLKAMLSRAAVLELPIVTVIDSLANVDTGALEARIQEYLAQAASIWSRLNITVVPGPRTPPLYMKNADIESSQDYYRRVRDAGLIMWHTNSVPVVFLAGAHVFDHGGLKNGGFAAPKTALKHPGVIGISDGAYPTTLAHEVGHALGLDDRSDDPSLLMFERVAGGTLHTAQEAITATGFFFARNGVGKP